MFFYYFSYKLFPINSKHFFKTIVRFRKIQRKLVKINVQNSGNKTVKLTQLNHSALAFCLPPHDVRASADGTSVDPFP